MDVPPPLGMDAAGVVAAIQELGPVAVVESRGVLGRAICAWPP
jgi:hypothetical protein